MNDNTMTPAQMAQQKNRTAAGEYKDLDRAEPAGATNALAPASALDDVVPTGEVILGRQNIVNHVRSGDLRLGERVNIRQGYIDVSGVLTRDPNGNISVMTDAGDHLDVYSSEYDNLTPHGLKGFRYQRAADEVDEDAAFEAAHAAHLDFLAGTDRDRDAEEAADHRAKAAESLQEAHDSFERSDTDGALSQWASGLMADKHLMMAQLKEQGGKHEFRALFDLEGNLVPAKVLPGKYGPVWAVLEDPEDTGGNVTAWVSPSKSRKAAVRRKNLEAKGYREGTVRTVATVRAHDGGGSYNVQHYFARIDGGYSPHVEIVSTDSDIEDY